MSKPQNIYTDMLMTGQLIKRLVSEGGYSVGDVQKKLGLSCPQPIYRWYKGQNMPSVDNLLALSQMLGIHMEDMLIQRDDTLWILQNPPRDNLRARLKAYCRQLLRQSSLRSRLSRFADCCFALPQCRTGA